MQVRLIEKVKKYFFLFFLTRKIWEEEEIWERRNFSIRNKQERFGKEKFGMKNYFRKGEIWIGEIANGGKRRNCMNLGIGIQTEMGWIHGSGYFTHFLWPNQFKSTKIKNKKCENFKNI